MITFSIFGGYKDDKLTRLRFVFRESGCFGSMQHNGAFTSPGFAGTLLDTDDHSITTGKLESLCRQLQKDEKFLAVGWTSDSSLSYNGEIQDPHGKLTSQNLPSSVKKILGTVHAVVGAKNGALAGQGFKSFQMSDCEVEILQFLRGFRIKLINGEKKESPPLSQSTNPIPPGYLLHKNAAVGGILSILQSAQAGVSSCMFCNWVGADRKSSFCVDFLMSYRNTYANSQTDTGGSTDIFSTSMKSNLAEHLWSKRNVLDPFACLSYICHWGDDSEIFIHGGQWAELVGAANGFHALEPFCAYHDTMQKAPQYNKGYQSSGLSRNLNEKGIAAKIGSFYKGSRLGTGYGGLFQKLVSFDIYSAVTRFLSDKQATVTIDNSRILSYMAWLKGIEAHSNALREVLNEDSKSNFTELIKKKEKFGEWLAGDQQSSTTTRPGRSTGTDGTNW